MDERMSLEPCPFCGATNGTTEPDRAQGDKWGYYMCECSARGPEVRTGYSESPTAAWRDEAISQWNTRHLAATKAQTVDVSEDAGTLVRFIFSYFGDVSMSHHLSDEVVAAVRRIEAIRTNP